MLFHLQSLSSILSGSVIFVFDWKFKRPTRAILTVESAHNKLIVGSKSNPRWQDEELVSFGIEISQKYDSSRIIVIRRNLNTNTVNRGRGLMVKHAVSRMTPDQRVCEFCLRTMTV